MDTRLKYTSTVNNIITNEYLIIICFFLFSLQFLLDKFVTNLNFILTKEYLKHENSKEKDYPNTIDDGSRIPPYEREGIIIPKESPDSVYCDDWENIISKNIRCCLDCGFSACFNCIETRVYLRICKHLNEDMVIFDPDKEHDLVLPKNEKKNEGYCMSEGMANGIDSGEDARRKCSIKNADWVLARKSTEGNTHYNFLCKCKYPHLLTNSKGLMSPCDKDVGCNGHGHLDPESVAGNIDPFLEGYCICDEENGWVSSRDELVGPICKTATFDEYPSYFFPNPTTDSIELYSDSVDRNFRNLISQKRQDGDRKVYLPNPCIKPCTLELYTFNGVNRYICTSRVEVVKEKGKKIQRLGLSIRMERDYFEGNGGKFPNFCLVINNNDFADKCDKFIRMQYLSHDWNKNGMYFSPDFGFSINKSFIDSQVNNVDNYLDKYKNDFENNLILSNKNAKGDTKNFFDFSTIWTYLDEEYHDQAEKLFRDIIVIDDHLSGNICVKHDYVHLPNEGWNINSIYRVPKWGSLAVPPFWTWYAIRIDAVCQLKKFHSGLTDQIYNWGDVEVDCTKCGYYREPSKLEHLYTDKWDKQTEDQIKVIAKQYAPYCYRDTNDLVLIEINCYPKNENKYGMLHIHLEEAIRTIERDDGYRYNDNFTLISENRTLYAPSNINIRQYCSSRALNNDITFSDEEREKKLSQERDVQYARKINKRYIKYLENK